jgi:hypothetical protein
VYINVDDVHSERDIRAVSEATLPCAVGAAADPEPAGVGQGYRARAVVYLPERIVDQDASDD